MSVSLKRKHETSAHTLHVRKKRLEYYGVKKEIVLDTKFDALPLEMLTEILKYASAGFEDISRYKSVNKFWYDACEIVEYYLSERSWWTIFKISRYMDSYDKIMVACLGNCSEIKSKYYDFCWTGIGQKQAHSILSSLQGTYHVAYDSHSPKKPPTFITKEEEPNKILQSCTLECLYMSSTALLKRIKEIEKEKKAQKLVNHELDEDGEYNFSIMSRHRVREVLGDYDYSQYNSSSDSSSAEEDIEPYPEDEDEYSSSEF